MQSTLQRLLATIVAILATMVAGCSAANTNDSPDGADAGGAAGAAMLPEAATPPPEGGPGPSEIVAEGESSVGTTSDAGDAEAATPSDGSAPDAGIDAATCSPYVTNVISVSYGPGAGFGQSAFPQVVMGPPSGGGCCKGSLNVLSLGEGGSIVVEMGQTIIDKPGPDFIVFENPFDIGNDPQNPFAEPGTVEVSADGVNWFGFPCTASAYPYGLCAGWHPVFANPATNTIDPLDPAVAGGDPFDLADLPGDAGITEARFVRITDRADLPGDFDLDAVAVVHGRCR
jgi:hypothetical protein